MLALSTTSTVRASSMTSIVLASSSMLISETTAVVISASTTICGEIGGGAECISLSRTCKEKSESPIRNWSPTFNGVPDTAIGASLTNVPLALPSS